MSHRRIDYPTQLYNSAFTGEAAFSAGGVSLDFDQDPALTRLEEITNTTLGIANTWTVMGWAKLTSGGSATIVDLGRNNQVTEYGIWLSANSVSDGFRIIVREGATIFKDYEFGTGAVGNWKQVVVTWNGTNLLTYVDGVEDTTPTKTVDNAGTQTDASRQIGIGANIRNGAQPFVGLIHQVAVWNVVLSAAEISSVYNSGNGNAVDLNSGFGSYTSQANLQHWWVPGRTASPSLGKDYVSTNQIDLEENGVDDTDITADAPTG